jgi:hypothetical protein
MGFGLMEIRVQQMVSEQQVSSSTLTLHALGGSLLDIGFNTSHEFRDMG